jgi:hypothetical protein
MHLWENKKRLTVYALVVLILFCGVTALHPLIPHNHSYETPGNSSIFTAVHTTAAEKFLIFSFTLLFAFSLPFFHREYFLNFQHFFVRIREKTDPGASRPALFIALSQGILNTKAY